MENALDSLRTGGQQPVLHRRIEFIPAQKIENGRNPNYFTNTPAATPEQPVISKPAMNSDTTTKKTTDGAALKQRIAMLTEWQDVTGIGCGIANSGHNSFVNAAIQCLAYCPPFVQMLLNDQSIASIVEEVKHESNDSSQYCPISCISSVIAMLREKGTTTSKSEVSPRQLLAWLHYCAPGLKATKERPVDAFLDVLLDAMTATILRRTGGSTVPLQLASGQVRLALPRLRPKTFVDFVFGGEVSCRRSCACADQVIAQAPTRIIQFPIQYKNKPLQVAMSHYLKSPAARGLFNHESDQDFDKCPDCSDTKFDVCFETAPVVLTVSYLSSTKGRAKWKVGDTIEPRIVLPCKSREGKQSNVEYSLFAVVSGQPPDTHIAYVKAPNSMWYKIQDTSVSSVKLKTVRSAEPSLLFYVSEAIATNSKQAPVLLNKTQTPAKIRVNDDLGGSVKLSREETDTFRKQQAARKATTKTVQKRKFLNDVSETVNKKQRNSVDNVGDSLSSLASTWRKESGGQKVQTKTYKSLNTSLFGDFLEDVSVFSNSSKTETASASAGASSLQPNATHEAKQLTSTKETKVQTKTYESNTANNSSDKSMEKDEFVVLNRHGKNKSNQWKDHLSETRRQKSKAKKGEGSQTKVWKKNSRYDEWDMALDAGKVKKVKNKESLGQGESSTNLRQALQRKHEAKRSGKNKQPKRR